MRRLTCLQLCCLKVLSLTACGAPKTEALDIFAMDTYVSLVAIGDGASDVLQKCSTQINTLEQKLSRTIATSDVSRLNADGTAQLDEDCLATALPHLCITPRCVEADGAHLLAALHGVDGQLPCGGCRADGGRIIHDVKDRGGGQQRRAAHHIPPPQQEDLHLSPSTGSFLILVPFYARTARFSTPEPSAEKRARDPAPAPRKICTFFPQRAC